MRSIMSLPFASNSFNYKANYKYTSFYKVGKSQTNNSEIVWLNIGVAEAQRILTSAFNTF